MFLPAAWRGDDLASKFGPTRRRSSLFCPAKQGGHRRRQPHRPVDPPKAKRGRCAAVRERRCTRPHRADRRDGSADGARSRNTCRCCTGGSTNCGWSGSAFATGTSGTATTPRAAGSNETWPTPSHSAAVQALNAAEDKLCFGRLDTRRRRVHAHRPDGHLRRHRRPAAAADGLAGAVVPAVLRRHRGQPARPAPAPLHPDPPPGGRGGQRRVPGPDRPGDGRRRGDLTGRSGR